MFKKDFLWGTASAATQIEGAYLEDGKALTIWDDLTEGKVKNNDTTYFACDHYHRYLEDIEILKKIGVNSYRFSINWARIIVDEKGTVNNKGLEFYHKLIDALIDANIKPIITMYHWDLPMWAYNRGGWKNPDIVSWFELYTKVLMEAYSDKVEYWITFNEPQCFVNHGYRTGIHAPFEKLPLKQCNNISRNVMLSHGRAVSLMRSICKQPLKIGFASANSCYCPLDESDAEINKAKELTFEGSLPSSIAYWSDPIMLGQCASSQDFLSDEDLSIISQPLDFYAFNTYCSTLQKEEIYTGMPQNSLFWPITPNCLYWSAKFFYERYKKPIFVSENGMANTDFVMQDGKVHDPQRIDFIQRYLTSLKKATDEVDVMGYQYWSLMDNFEWAEGYDIRFGLVYVDYTNFKRTLKDSAYYFADIIKTNGKNI